MASVPEVGWPRPRGEWLDESGRRLGLEVEPETLPVPWVLARAADGKVAWTVFHGQAHTAHPKRLCQVCGEELGTIVLLGLAEDTGNEGHRTSGPGCHPRCMALTLSFCPHFRDLPANGTVAYAYTGPGTGYRAFDGPDDPEPTPSQIEEVYTATVAIAPDALPMSACLVKELARRDPTGSDPVAASRLLDAVAKPKPQVSAAR